VATTAPAPAAAGSAPAKQGYNWRAPVRGFEFRASDLETRSRHVVNNAMALKASAVWLLFSRDGATSRGATANRRDE
jgi:hypothetical protein